MNKLLKNLIRPEIIVLSIPLLITGPFIPDLIVSLSAFIFLVFVFKNNLYFYFKKKPLVIFFIFCLYCILLSVFVAEDKLLSLKSSLFYFRVGVFSCLVWYLIEKDIKILQYFYYVFLLSFLILVLDGYLQYYTGFNILGFPEKHGRISSLFGDEWVMGGYLSRLYPLALALCLLRKHSKLELYFVTLLFCLTSGLIYFSGERTALFFHLLSLIFIILFRKLRLNKMLVLVFFITSILILTSTNNNLKNRILNLTLQEMGVKNEKKYIITPAHDSLFKTAFNMFLDKPLYGHGPKMFRIICKDEKYATGVSPCSTHPHNFYIQLLAETGIIGFIFLFSAFMYVIYCVARQLKSILLKKNRYLTDYQVCLLACLLINLWPFSPNGNFFNNWLAICYSLPVGFYLHSIYGRNKKEIL